MTISKTCKKLFDERDKVLSSLDQKELSSLQISEIVYSFDSLIIHGLCEVAEQQQKELIELEKLVKKVSQNQ